jgi:hypothetical protein
MPACGPEHLYRRQVFAFNAEDIAAPGEDRVPGNLEIPAFEAIRGSRPAILIFHRIQASGGFVPGIHRTSIKNSNMWNILQDLFNKQPGC